MGMSPSVVVSSTFYDLRQVRSDLAKFLREDLGYQCLVSEHPSFPVNPSLGTVENCKEQVLKNADLMVLVIGGRYGSIDDKSAKSVTNLEFLAARQKGIPVYAFVEKNTLAVLPVWRSSPDADFSKVVDTPMVFEFIEKVRSQENIWTSEFETAKDIIDKLRLQFSYLFQEALEFRKRLSGAELPSYLTALSPTALRIALEKPDFWEFKLLLRCMADNVASQEHVLREYRAGLKAEPAEFVRAEDAVDWFQTRLHELAGLAASQTSLINEQAPQAVGEPGIEGSAQDIVWTALMMGKIYRSSLEWAQRIRCARIEPPFDRLAAEAALFIDDLVHQFNEYPAAGLEKIEKAMKTRGDGTRQKIDLTFVLDIANVERFNKALGEVEREFQSGKSRR